MPLISSGGSYSLFIYTFKQMNLYIVNNRMNVLNIRHDIRGIRKVNLIIANSPKIET